jgi:hypothetical protein
MPDHLIYIAIFFVCLMALSFASNIVCKTKGDHHD